MTTTAQARIVFIAALPREISSLVHGWRADETSPKRGIHLYWNEHAIVACAGMGAHRARLAVEAALALGPASQLVSIGWAGACRTPIGIGDIIHANIVVDAKTGERFFTAIEPSHTQTQDQSPQIVVTVPQPAGVPEKQRLAQSYQATAVEMEAAAVARLARAHDLPFYAIKAISDAADFDLPDLARFTTPGGTFREAAFGLHVALRPALWASVITLARGSKLAAGNLRKAIDAHIALHRKQGNETA